MVLAQRFSSTAKQLQYKIVNTQEAKNPEALVKGMKNNEVSVKNTKKR
jgi:hypothetical protein